MICPHCRKPFKIGQTKPATERAASLLKKGYNLREVERQMQGEGFVISFTTVSKIRKEMRDRGEDV